MSTDLMVAGRCFGVSVAGLEAGEEDVDAELERVLGGDALPSSGQDEPARLP
jgi:hypothetical protein